jgi:hypothetical protein
MVSCTVARERENYILASQLAFLATMSAAILAITPHPPNFATAAWLGVAGLSACGLFTVQYFPIKAFTITDEDMGELVRDGNHYINVALLATAVASPVIITLWSSILFAAGIIDYIIETPLGGAGYKAFGLVPVGFGVAVVGVTMLSGRIIERRVEARVSKHASMFRVHTD